MTFIARLRRRSPSHTRRIVPIPPLPTSWLDLVARADVDGRAQALDELLDARAAGAAREPRPSAGGDLVAVLEVDLGSAAGPK
jgi:hypothetical protein